MKDNKHRRGRSGFIKAGACAAVRFARPDLILAAKDRVATDSLAVAVLKLYGAEKNVNRAHVTKSFWDQVQIYYSAELGLGQGEPDKISIDEIKVNCG
jgi:uncharacterized protein (DUF362 family)